MREHGRRADGRRVFSADFRTADRAVPRQIQAVTNSRVTRGDRRVWAMANRTFRTGYNRKSIRRVTHSRRGCAPSARARHVGAGKEEGPTTHESSGRRVGISESTGHGRAA